MVNPNTQFKRKTDWQQILNEIDLPGREIAKKLGISESYVSYIRRGYRSKVHMDYDIGCAIMALHKMRQREKELSDNSHKEEHISP